MKNLNDLINLAHNKSDLARNELAQKTSQEFLNCKETLNREQIILFTDVINKLYNILPIEAKLQLSNTLAISEWCPENILQTIAEDKIEFAAPVLSFSNNLSDDTLVNIIHNQGFEYQILIAERPNIGTNVTDALADTENEEIAIAVGKNLNASISQHSYKKFVALIKTNRDALGYYAIRRDIPEEVADVIVNSIIKHYEITEKEISKDKMNLISAMGKKQKSTELEECVCALNNGNKDKFISLAADYLKISSLKLKANFTNGSLKDYMLIIRAMGLDAKAVEYIYNQYSPNEIIFDNEINKEILIYWITTPVSHALRDVKNKFA